jgi:hypothetical protein
VTRGAQPAMMMVPPTPARLIFRKSLRDTISFSPR